MSTGEKPKSCPVLSKHSFEQLLLRQVVIQGVFHLASGDLRGE
jgi:hypothetical protein